MTAKRKPRKRPVPFGGIIRRAKKGDMYEKGTYAYTFTNGDENEAKEQLERYIANWKAQYKWVSGWKKVQGNAYRTRLYYDAWIFIPYDEIPYNELGEISL